MNEDGFKKESYSQLKAVQTRVFLLRVPANSVPHGGHADHNRKTTGKRRAMNAKHIVGRLYYLSPLLVYPLINSGRYTEVPLANMHSRDSGRLQVSVLSVFSINHSVVVKVVACISEIQLD